MAERVDDGSIHSGVFRAVVTLVRSEEIVEGDDALQGQPGDVVRVRYLDERHMGEGAKTVLASAQCIEGTSAAFA